MREYRLLVPQFLDRHLSEMRQGTGVADNNELFCNALLYIGHVLDVYESRQAIFSHEERATNGESQWLRLSRERLLLSEPQRQKSASKIMSERVWRAEHYPETVDGGEIEEVMFRVETPDELDNVVTQVISAGILLPLKGISIYRAMYKWLDGGERFARGVEGNVIPAEFEKYFGRESTFIRV